MEISTPSLIAIKDGVEISMLEVSRAVINSWPASGKVEQATVNWE
jgi:hypothetical protein